MLSRELKFAGFVVVLGVVSSVTRLPAASLARVPNRYADAVGGTEQDRLLAQSSKEAYAWKLFMALNQQAKAKAAGVPDNHVPFPRSLPDRPVVWETWARSSGGRLNPNGHQTNLLLAHNTSEVFKSRQPDPANDHGMLPVRWGTWQRKTSGGYPIKIFGDFDSQLIQGLEVQQGASGDGTHGALLPQAKTSPDHPEGDEIRMNRATYEFVVANKLYYAEGVAARIHGGPITLPADSKEVKGVWIPVSAKDAPRYHWRWVRRPDGSRVRLGLAALHIITKDLPNWFWCTFEHEDVVKNGPAFGYPDASAFPSTATPASVQSVLGTTKWSHYQLRGAQIAYDNPPQLGNSIIERRDLKHSSCMNCHMRAATNGVHLTNGRQALNVFLLHSETGTPDPDPYAGNEDMKSLDFMWSIPLRVLSRDVPPIAGPK